MRLSRDDDSIEGSMDRDSKIDDETNIAEARFPIVGIGASAGGLAAFEAFFSAMPDPPETDMAFVLVQHLAPDHKSMLTDLVKRYTSMQVIEVEDGMRVEPGCAYIIPPNRDMAFLNGALHLFEPGAPRGLRLPIDFFFRSLAQDQGDRAICIVLSGTGSDGTLGIRAVKGEGGIVMAQTPESTSYDGMPRSAIATGLVDFVLAPEKMPAQLVAYATRAFDEKAGLVTAPEGALDANLKKISVVLRDMTGHDFSQYKRNTLARRIERRMAILQIERIEDYLRYLRQTSEEAQALFRDLLIGVTNFFRDPAAFGVLEMEALPRLFAEKANGATIRAWVCGCSTGEEAYSTAILLQERLEKTAQTLRLQIFATDIDREAIDRARDGLYPPSIAADISPERLERFFQQEPGEDGYRIKKAIRDLIVFSEQDLIKDPPFSKLDLICCRNLLIYLSGSLQKKVLPLFHYALNERGILFLGNSESVGEQVQLFETLDNKAKIFLRRGDSPEAARPSFGFFVPSLAEAAGRGGPAGMTGRNAGRVDLRAVMERALLEHFGASAILVRGRGEILHIWGRTGKYLKPASGDAEMNILAMAREGLQFDLIEALRESVARNEFVQRFGLRVKESGGDERFDLTVRPIAIGAPASPLPDAYLVIVQEHGSAPPDRQAPPAAGTGAEEAPASVDLRIRQLETALRLKEDYLQATFEEMETANEELKSSNEELQSVNEEFQSTNEELETSKEEIQSVNEELATVNTELQNKVSDLSKMNTDMNYLLAGTGVGTLFVDYRLLISRFTPNVSRIINLIQSDIGRPVGDIASNLATREVEVQSRDGSWYFMRIGPYRTQEHVIEGAVITFVDITARKRTELSLGDALRFSQSIVATLREPFLVLDEELRVITANPAYYRRFEAAPNETEGRLLYELGDGQWNDPELRVLLEGSLRDGGNIEDYRTTRGFGRLGERTLALNARLIRNESESGGRILLAIEDVTERRG
jgi:two-component system CheB/CheR fusion protein